MGKIIYDKVQERIYNSSPIGRAYWEYNEKVGGKPFGYTLGMDLSVDIDKEYGGLVGLYHECIKQGKTWEDLLGTDGKWDELITEE
jgi:hypothetical protein